MGFFSQNCEGCGHSILSMWSTTGINDWMQQAVAIFPSGTIVTGVYDGYGRLEDDQHVIHEEAVGYDNTTWHLACWRKAGSPTGYLGKSEWARDQGFFFSDGAHDVAEPR